MSRGRRSNASVSTVQIIAAAMIVLAALVVGAFLFAPERTPPPPVSAISYQELPENAQPGREDSSPAMGEVPRATRPKPPPTAADAAPAGEDAAGLVDEAAGYVIRGTVTDASDGSPLAGARVSARQGTFRGASRSAFSSSGYQAETGADGTYVLEVFEEDVYTVAVTMPGFVAVTLETPRLSDALPEAELDFQMDSGATISGRVTEAGGSTPAPGVRVIVQGRRDVVAVTDDRGDYELQGVETGDIPVTLDLRNTPYTAGKALPFKKVRVTAPNAVVANVNFEVEAAGIVWGHVQTHKGDPIPKADVVLCTSDSPLAQAINAMARQAPPLTATSDDEGYYELRGVPLNEPWRLYSTVSSHAPQMADPFLLTSAKRTVRVDIFMFAGTNITGVVESTRGGGVGGAQVTCIPAYSKLLTPMDSPQAFRNATADADGRFSIAELPPGEYQIMAQAKGFKIPIQGYPVYPDGYNDLTNVRLQLSPVDEGNFSIFGVVSDATGLGVDGAEVRLEGMGLADVSTISRTESTSGGGKFVFDGVSQGAYTLVVSKDGYTPVTVRRVRLNEEMRVVLTQSAVVRGIVKAKDTGRAPALYQVAALPLSADGSGRMDMMSMLGGATNSMSFDNPYGSFELRVDAGAHRLEAKAEGYAPAREEITLEAGQVLEGVVLELEDSGGRIAGTVVAGDNGNVQGAEVVLVEAASAAEAMILSANVPQDRTRQVGQDGAFAFENLPAGLYFVLARHPRYATATEGPVELSQGGRQENIRLRLGYGGAVEGYVFTEGRATPGAVVMVVGGGDTKTTTTDEQGYYHIDGLSTGVFQAMVTELSSGDISSVYGARGLQVTIEEGRTARCDFGGRSGARIEGQCFPGPANMLGGRVVLQMPGMIPGPLGGTADLSQLTGQSSGINPLGTFVLEDVPPGEWQLNVYYFELGGRNPLQVRFVHTEVVSVGSEEVIPLTLQVSNY